MTALLVPVFCFHNFLLAALPPFNGGIAQLVERQLCKLDVWGSNPHASTNYLVGWDENFYIFLIAMPPLFSVRLHSLFSPKKGL